MTDDELDAMAQDELSLQDSGETCGALRVDSCLSKTFAFFFAGQLKRIVSCANHEHGIHPPYLWRTSQARRGGAC